MGDVLQPKHLDHLVGMMTQARVGLGKEPARHRGLDFEKRVHRVPPRDLNRSATESSPPGRYTINTITAKPKIARYQSCRKRSHSGSSTTTTDPSTGPKNRPDPPTITASNINSDT